jgi:O-antigen ligase
VGCVLLCGLQLAVWPGLEQPGRAVRQAILLVAIAPLIALLARAARSPFPRALALAVLLPVGAGVAGWLSAPPGEQPSVLQDLLVQAALWATALVAATAPPCSRDERTDRVVAVAAAVAVAIVGVWGLIEAWGGWSSPVAVRRPAASYVNRNVAAQALVPLLPLTLAAAAAARRRSHRWPCLAAAALGLMLLVVIRGRGSWIAALLAAAATAVLLAVWARGRIRWRALAVPAVGLTACAAAAAWVPYRGVEPLPTVRRSVELLVTEYEGSTLETREALWRNGLAMLRDQPWLGTGPGRFRVVYPLYHDAAVRDARFGLDKQPAHAHNDLLQSAVELGLPAALVLLALVVVAAARTAREVRQTHDGGRLALLAGRFAALVGVCAHGMVSFPWASAASGVVAWWLVGRGWAGREPVLRWPGRHPRLWLAACLVLALAAGAAGVRMAVGLAGAQAALGDALRAHRTGELERAAGLARTAADRASHRHELGLAAALVWSSDRRAEPSLEVLEPALAAHPHHINLLLNTGARRLKAGRPGQARRAFEHAVRIQPELSRGWLGLAMSAARLGRGEEAARACARAVRDPDLPQARAFCYGNGLLEPPASPR